MSQHALLSADLDVSVALPTPPGTTPGRTLTASLRGQDSHLELAVDDLELLAGRLAPAAAASLATVLARRGVVVTVVDETGPVVAVGAVRSSWLQRRLTRSAHIRLRRPAAVPALIRARRRGRRSAGPSAELPLSALLPPSTLLPLAPTFRRLRRRPVTTTHDPAGGGEPRLVFALGAAAWPDSRQRVFALGADVVTIGSDADADLRLDGLDGQHAEIQHDEDDEFVLVRTSESGSTRVNGAEIDRQVLRTGSRVQLGEWTLSYMREEYADHGRPYGGRIGGEAGRQRSQPPRQRLDRSTTRRPPEHGGAG